MADLQTPQNDSSTRIMFLDQLVLRDLIVRAVINDQSTSVCVTAALSVHLTARTSSAGETLDHRYDYI